MSTTDGVNFVWRKLNMKLITVHPLPGVKNKQLMRHGMVKETANLQDVSVYMSISALLIYRFSQLIVENNVD